jgi:hypothetical protein
VSDKERRSRAASAMNVFEEMDAELRDNKPGAVEFAKSILHEMVESSDAPKLRVLLVGPTKYAQLIMEKS